MGTQWTINNRRLGRPGYHIVYTSRYTIYGRLPRYIKTHLSAKLQRITRESAPVSYELCGVCRVKKRTECFIAVGRATDGKMKPHQMWTDTLISERSAMFYIELVVVVVKPVSEVKGTRSFACLIAKISVLHAQLIKLFDLYLSKLVSV